MAFKILYQSAAGDLEKAMTGIYRPIAEAGTAAIAETAADIKTRGRADIAAAGFGKRWQNTFRVDVFPGRGRVSANAAALVYHKIPYADVFESGATIRGKPMLWLPLKSTPKRIGRQKMTPELFGRKIGPLFPLRSSGGRPMLGANISTNRRGQKVDRPPVTLSALRRGASGSGLTRAVPLFIGVDSVKLRDRFSLREITDRSAAQLPALYAKHLNAG